MAQPPHFPHATYPNHICKLPKAIHGLKQAPEAWYNEVANYLLSCGFTRSVADASLFIHHHHLAPIYLIVYVDDIILTSSGSHALNELIQQLASRFGLKDLGFLSYFLGVEVLPTA